MKRILALSKDVVFLAIILCILGIGFYGVRLPYRGSAIDSGPFQLEAFQTGLALYQFGRVSPFYSISPLNDYVVTDWSPRLVHLTKSMYDQKKFTTSLQAGTLTKLITVIGNFAGLSDPAYTITESGFRADYTSRKEGNDLIITKTIHFDRPVTVKKNAITLSYNASDVVIDMTSGQVLTDTPADIVDQIHRRYDIAVLTAAVPAEEVTLTGGGIVAIINPSIPGYLTVQAHLGQTLSINRRYQLIEAVNMVNDKSQTVRTSIEITGHRAGGK